MKKNALRFKFVFHILTKVSVLILTLTGLEIMTARAAPSELFWNTNGTTEAWTNANWDVSPVGTFTTAWVTNSDVEFTTNSTLTFTTTSIGNVTVDSNQNVTVTAGGTLSMSNGVVRTFTIGSGASLVWNSQTVTANSTGGITKNGAGTLNLGAWTFTTVMNGGFTLNAGTVIVSGAKALGNGAMTINGGTLLSTNGNVFPVTSLTIGGDFAFGGTGNDLWTNTSLGSVTRNITNNISSGSGNTRIFGGVISGGAGAGLTFWGGDTNGTINITNAGNTFTGLININGGEVVFANDGSFGTVPSSATTNAIVIDGGRLNAANAANNAVIYTLNSNRGIQLGATAGTSINVPFTLNPLTFGSLNYNGVIADKAGVAGTLVKQGQGSLTLGGTNTYSGNTIINSGALTLSGSGSIANSPNIVIGAIAFFDVTGLSSTFILGSSQTLSNSAPGGNFIGNVNVGLGTVSLIYTSNMPSLTNLSGTLTISNSTVFKINNIGPPLATGSYWLIATRPNSSSVFPANTLPTPIIGGGGITNTGAAASLQTNARGIFPPGLFLVVSRATPVVQTSLSATAITYGQSLSNSTISGAFTNAVGVGVPGTFAFVTPSAIPSAGVTNPAVIFIPTDTASYNIVTNNVSVTANVTQNITGITYIGGNIAISFASVSNSTNFVQWTTNLATQAWTTISTNVAGADGIWQYTDTNPPSPSFYRSMQLP